MDQLDEQMMAALQKQFDRERRNQSVYFHLSLEFLRIGLPGFSAWASRQAGEEMEHAAKIGRYVADIRGGKVLTRALEPVEFEIADVRSAIELGAAAEAETTEAILELSDLADMTNDRGVLHFLFWFIQEQESSEAEFKTRLQQLDLIAGDNTAILAMDADLAEGGG